MKKLMTLGVAALALATGVVTGVASPASATVAGVAFSPTSDLEPGTTLTNVVISTNGDFLCESAPGTEALTGNQVTYGVEFYSSEDEIWDDGDEYLGNSRDESGQTYTSGDTESDPFTAEMGVLFGHDPELYLLGVGYCFNDTFEEFINHGTGVTITYSDLTLSETAAAAGSSVTASIIDGTTDGQFCGVDYGTTGPYSIGLDFYTDIEAWWMGEASATAPVGWDSGSPGVGSFSSAALATGVNVDFTVPADLAAGDYLVYAWCIDSEGDSEDGIHMGLVPLTVTAASLPATGVNAAEVAGAAALGSSLIALGGIVWVLRRRAIKA